MKEGRHTVLFVDDEESILNSLRRLLRKEPYDILTASSGKEGLAVLAGQEVQLVVSDQRMPEMSGIEFLTEVKKNHPDTIRIILSGYTQVNSVMEAVNTGHVYKYLLKPWDNQQLMLELRQALEYYELQQANKRLDRQVVEQNRKLKEMNENLENLVRQRTRKLEMQNRALELTYAILAELPVALMGVSLDGMISLTNRKVQSLDMNGRSLQMGTNLQDHFKTAILPDLEACYREKVPRQRSVSTAAGQDYVLDLIPLEDFEAVVVTVSPG